MSVNFSHLFLCDVVDPFHRLPRLARDVAGTCRRPGKWNWPELPYGRGTLICVMLLLCTEPRPRIVSLLIEFNAIGHFKTN